MITRREFVSALGAAAYVGHRFPVRRGFSEGGSGAAVAQDDVAGLYDRSIVIDALANPGSMNVSWPPRGFYSSR